MREALQAEDYQEDINQYGSLDSLISAGDAHACV